MGAMELTKLMTQLVMALVMVVSFGLGDDLDLFSSMSDMQKLFEREQELNSLLSKHLETIDNQIRALDTFLEQYSRVNYSALDPEEYVSHPINTFALIKRTSVEWPAVQKVLFNPEAESELQSVISALDHFPGTKDLQGALNGIFLLHETYDLNLTKLAMGEIEVPGTGGKVIRVDQQMNAEDMFILAKLSFNRGFLDRAIEFVLVAEWLATKLPEEHQDLQKNIKNVKATLIKTHDDTLLRKGPRGKDWKTYQVPLNPKLAAKKAFKKITEKKYRVPPEMRHSLEDHVKWDMFNEVCRGEDRRSPEQKKHLTSFFLHHNDPYLRLGPFKLDVQELSPFIAIFRDFFNDEEMTAYVRTAEEDLHRSSHEGRNVETTTSLKRTSKQIWLRDSIKVANDGGEYLPEAERIAHRIVLATRMYSFVLKGGEPFQVANYGIGGVYNHHYDTNGAGTLQPVFEGDRLATFMGYLSDVEAGGATVFPRVGVASWPRKGDAIFWYNMDRMGLVDKDTLHGGCPVIKGSKWITNKWIRFYQQMFSFPCLLDPDQSQRLPPLSNHLGLISPVDPTI